MTAVRTAVILAAGLGSRLHGEELPKPLRSVAGVPLLERTLKTLARGGIEEAIVVVGYRHELITVWLAARGNLGLRVRFAYNPAWRLSNGLSVQCARFLVEGPFLLLMADHVMTPGMVRALAAKTPPKGGAILMVDYDLPGVFDMDDATKVQSDGAGNLVAIGKSLTDYDCVDTGLFCCSAGLFAELDRVYEERGDASLSNGIASLAAQGRMALEPIPPGDWWQDVDTPEALAEAERRLA
jgi:choline kinase